MSRPSTTARTARTTSSPASACARRATNSSTTSTPSASIPQSRRLWIFNGFVQDRFALTRELSLIAGVKVERSSSPGFELLPNLRIAWQPEPTAPLLGGGLARGAHAVADRPRARIRPADPRARDRFPLGEADRVRGRLSRPAERRRRRSRLGLLQPLRRYPHRRVQLGNAAADPAQQRPRTATPTASRRGAAAQVAPWWRLSVGVSLLGKHFRLEAGHDRHFAARPRSATIPNYQLFCCARR